VITQELYDARSVSVKFVPVLFASSDKRFIPEPLRGHTHYVLNSSPDYERLCDYIAGAAGVEPGVIGTSKTRERRRGMPLSFENRDEPMQTRRPVDISRIVKHAPADLVGRDNEVSLLNAAWQKVCTGDPLRFRLMTFVAFGGEGKTSLVAKWAADLAHRDWPGCDAVFAWSFYDQGTRPERATSSDVFLKEALVFFGDAAMAHSARGASEKSPRLSKLVSRQRALLIIDGIEPLQYPPHITHTRGNQGHWLIYSPQRLSRK
jgi:hypothetical protein